jgi:hypothetical protein
MDLTRIAALAYLIGLAVITVGVCLVSVPAGVVTAGVLMSGTGVWALKESE